MFHFYCSKIVLTLIFLLQEAKKTIPHLWNLNQDPILNGMVVHFTYPGTTSFGSTAESNVQLKGLRYVILLSHHGRKRKDMEREHCDNFLFFISFFLQGTRTLR